MSVRNAVEKAEQEPAGPPVHVMVREAIERQAAVLDAVLPEYMPRARFEQTTLAIIKATPKLLRCFETLEGRTSVLFGIIQAAATGLEIGGVAKEAFLIPRERREKVNGKWRSVGWEATFQLGYPGVQKLARRDPNVRQILADVVRDGDEFDHYRTLDGEHFHHRVVGSSEGRELTHAYCLVRYHNGATLAVVLDRAAVEKRREVSSSYKAELRKREDERAGFWFDWEAEMWAKTAVHATKRHLDLAPEDRRALDSDDQAVVREMLTETAGRPPVRRPGIAAGRPGWTSFEVAHGSELYDDPGHGDAFDVHRDDPDQGQPSDWDQPARTDWDDDPQGWPEPAPGHGQPLVSVAELTELMEGRATAIIAALQQEFPDRADELTTPADIHADPQALDRALAIIEEGR